MSWLCTSVLEVHVVQLDFIVLQEVFFRDVYDKMRFLMLQFFTINVLVAIHYVKCPINTSVM